VPFTETGSLPRCVLLPSPTNGVRYGQSAACKRSYREWAAPDPPAELVGKLEAEQQRRARGEGAKLLPGFAHRPLRSEALVWATLLGNAAALLRVGPQLLTGLLQLHADVGGDAVSGQ
jgi:hypothetical protein